MFDSISDDELIQVISEIKEDNEKGIVREDGIIRKYVKLTNEITGRSVSETIVFTELLILREAAFRWHNWITEVQELKNSNYPTS